MPRKKPIENETVLKGQITLSEHVLVTDPIYSIKEWCQVTVDNMVPGVYNCFEQRYDGKIARIFILKEGVEFESLEFSQSVDILGMDDANIGIFDYQYIKDNKTTHDKEWRNALKEKTFIQEKNENYRTIEESTEFKKYVKKYEKKKKELYNKSRYRPDLQQLLDDLFVYDPNVPTKDLNTILTTTQCPSYYLDSISLFIEARAKVMSKYRASNESEEFIMTPVSAVYEDKCFVSSPNIKDSPFACYLGFKPDSDVVEGILVDFDIIEYKDEEIEDAGWIMPEENGEDTDEIERENVDFSQETLTSATVVEGDMSVDDDDLSKMMSEWSDDYSDDDDDIEVENVDFEEEKETLTQSPIDTEINEDEISPAAGFDEEDDLENFLKSLIKGD